MAGAAAAAAVEEAGPRRAATKAVAAAAPRQAIEVARGALMAVHAASGLAAEHSVTATRMLRAAEGLVRAAVGVLAVAEATPLADQCGPPTQPPAPLRRKRRRRRGTGKSGEPPSGGEKTNDKQNEVKEQGGECEELKAESASPSGDPPLGPRWMEVDAGRGIPSLPPTSPTIPSTTSEEGAPDLQFAGTGIAELARRAAIAGPEAEAALANLLELKGLGKGTGQGEKVKGKGGKDGKKKK